MEDRSQLLCLNPLNPHFPNFLMHPTKIEWKEQVSEPRRDCEDFVSQYMPCLACLHSTLPPSPMAKHSKIFSAASQKQNEGHAIHSIDFQQLNTVNELVCNYQAFCHSYLSLVASILWKNLLKTVVIVNLVSL